MIHFSALQEQELYCLYLHAVASGEWGGAYDALSPTQKLCVFYRHLRGAACGKYCSFGVVYFDLGGGMQYNCLVFQAQRCIYVTHQMQNMHGGSHMLHFSVASTTMHTGTNQKAQQSCGSGTDKE